MEDQVISGENGSNLLVWQCCSCCARPFAMVQSLPTQLAPVLVTDHRNWYYCSEHCRETRQNYEEIVGIVTYAEVCSNASKLGKGDRYLRGRLRHLPRAIFESSAPTDPALA